LKMPPDHLLLDNAPNLGPLISRWENNKFENCWYESVRILEVLKLLFQQFLNLSSSQRDMSGPMLGDLSDNRWSGGVMIAHDNELQSVMVLPFRFCVFRSRARSPPIGTRGQPSWSSLTRKSSRGTNGSTDDESSCPSLSSNNHSPSGIVIIHYPFICFVSGLDPTDDSFRVQLYQVMNIWSPTFLEIQSVD
jgi:hypothetical protein